MSAHHFILPDVGGDRLTVSGAEGHHAVRVLRMRAGEPVTASDGHGSVVEGIVSVSGDELVIEVRARRAVPAERPAVHVFPAVPKSGKLELVVQKLTEVGVASITPWAADRSVARWDERKGRAHAERLRAVALAAGQQARAAWIPTIHEPVAGRPLPVGEAFVLHEGTGQRLAEALPASAPADVSLVIGPEGGLTDDEVGAFEAAGARVVGLGPRILRAETATIVGCVLVLARFHRLG